MAFDLERAKETNNRLKIYADKLRSYDDELSDAGKFILEMNEDYEEAISEIERLRAYIAALEQGMTIAVITRKDLEGCKTCAIGFDMLHFECYSCTRYPGRKDNYKPLKGD